MLLPKKKTLLRAGPSSRPRHWIWARRPSTPHARLL